MRSGFPVHVEYDVTLRQRRANWFDREVTQVSWEYVVWYDPVRDRFVVEDADQREEVADEAQLDVRSGRVYAVELDPGEPGTFYYRSNVTVRTLSDEDVDEVFEWLRGNDGDRVRRPNIFTRAARRLLVQLAPLPRLEREGRSREFVWR